MNGTAHASYSFLIFTLLHVTLFRNVPTGGLSVLALLFGMFPDIDGLYWKLTTKSVQSDNSFQHHLYYPTHWPVSYLPLVAWVVVSYFLSFHFPYFLAMLVGIYAHLTFDSMGCGDGMNWGAPWGRRFVNLFSGKTDGYHGNYWGYRYRKTAFFIVENIAAVACIGLLAWFSTMRPGSAGWYIFAMVGLGVLVLTGFIPIDARYAQEPPGGRYNDYRKIPGYWDNLPRKHKQRVEAWWKDHPSGA